LKSNPFWLQDRTKSNNRQMILTTISKRSPTHGELLKEVGLSKPILSKYLHELEKEGQIARQVKGRRIEYILTDRGKRLEELRKEAVATAFHAIRELVRDYPAARSLFELSKLSKEDPLLVEDMMRSFQEFLNILLSDNMSRWLQSHPRGKGGQALKKELMNKIPEIRRSTEAEDSPIIYFQKILKAMQEIISSHSGQGNEK